MIESIQKDSLIKLWGHTLSEYNQMFALSSQDANKRIVDVASGFSSFNKEMNDKHKNIISVDPAYAMPQDQLQAYFTTGFNNFIEQIQASPSHFVWQDYHSLNNFAKLREKMLRDFIADFEIGKSEGRYIANALPKLNFTDQQFELALCSYFLFTTHENDVDFHVNAITELCRVAGEARIFPLLNSQCEPSALIAPVILTLQQQNYGVEVKEVAYEFEKGGNAMLRVWAQTCEVI